MTKSSSLEYFGLRLAPPLNHNVSVSPAIGEMSGCKIKLSEEHETQAAQRASGSSADHFSVFIFTLVICKVSKDGKPT